MRAERETTTARGDHIRVYRNLYFHHGIDCGDGTVIHFTGEVGAKQNAAIKHTSWEEFLKDGRVERARYPTRHQPGEVIRRAKSRLGETNYSLVFNNCEHFANWCVTGKHRSAQVMTVGAVATAVGMVLAAEFLSVPRSRARELQKLAARNVRQAVQDDVTWEPLRPSLTRLRNGRAKQLSGS